MDTIKRRAQIAGPALTTFNPHQLDSLSYLFVRLHGAGIRFASIYLGLWLFPFGALVVRSGFIPRWLGWRGNA